MKRGCMQRNSRKEALMSGSFAGLRPVQGDAGAAAAFVVPLNVGRLHAGSNAREACSAGGGDVVRLFFR